MSRVYIRLLAIAAVAVSFTGASFSIAGLAKLFSGASNSVIFMASALEFAKLVVTGFFYRYWGHIPTLLRAYLTTAVVLIAITSMGIFGYLSAAYQQSSMKLHTDQTRLVALKGDHERIQKQLGELHGFIDAIPNSFITKKLKFRKEYEPEIARLQKKAEGITQEISAINIEMLKTQAEIGPIIYFAEAVGLNPEACIRILIFLFVIVFDPLAVCLVFSSNLAIRLREKYRGNEAKISAHSMATPVDHRFKHRFKESRFKKVG